MLHTFDTIYRIIVVKVSKNTLLFIQLISTFAITEIAKMIEEIRNRIRNFSPNKTETAITPVPMVEINSKILRWRVIRLKPYRIIIGTAFSNKILIENDAINNPTNSAHFSNIVPLVKKQK